MCPETGRLALRTRESDQFWTGRPVESLMDGDEEDAMLEEIQVSTLNHASASFLIIRLTRYFCTNFLQDQVQIFQQIADYERNLELATVDAE